LDSHTELTEDAVLSETEEEEVVETIDMKPAMKKIE
jgi:hypothetical protein